MSKKLCVVWLSIVLMVLSSSSVSAQDFDADEYKRRLDAATEVYKSGDLSAALMAYLEVRSKFSGPEIDYSLARTYHKLHQCDDAQTFYTFVMNSYDLPEENALFQKSANYYTELLNCQAWGKVEVQCTAGGALFINDEPMGACLNRPYTMRAGTYTMRLEGPDVEPVEEKVRLEDGVEKTAALELEARVVEKIVEIQPDGSRVVVEEKPINWLGWSLVGVGAASLTAAAFFNAAGFAAMQDVQKAADAGDGPGRKTAEDDVALNQILTGVTLGLGVAAAGTGITLLILDALDDGETDAASGLELQFSAGPIENGGAVLLEGRF